MTSDNRGAWAQLDLFPQSCSNSRSRELAAVRHRPTVDDTDEKQLHLPFKWRPWKDEYAVYLKSERWRKLRIVVSLRAHGMCEAECGRRGRHVAHLTYVRKYRERPSDLLFLCRECHRLLDDTANGREPELDVAV